jgi:hypothetical protein
MSAMSRTSLDSNLAFLLKVNFGEAKAALYNFYSFPIGFACSLSWQQVVHQPISKHWLGGGQPRVSSFMRE